MAGAFNLRRGIIVASSAVSADSSVSALVGPEEVARVLRERDNFLIVSHIRPDGDCFGSATALLAGLEAMGKRVASYNASGPIDKLRFIPGADRISDQLPDWTPDVTVFVDCGGVKRVSPEFEPQGLTINIDHHATNDAFADLNYIDIGATAVGEQILIIFDVLGITITPGIATSLMTSITSDTGSYRYPNTSARSFLTAARLCEAGADPAWICLQLYESRTEEEVRLTARALNRLQIECGGRLAWSELLMSDYRECGGVENEPEGLVTEMRSIHGVEISILFHETESGGIRAGFRGKGGVDCAGLAQVLGGGGHFNAAGYHNPTVKYEAEREHILELARKKVREAFAK
jgi:phosphoesterase RecJ-like protein